MQSSNNQCSFCKTEAHVNRSLSGTLVTCTSCGTFAVDKEIQVQLLSRNEPDKLRRAGKLLCERRGIGENEPYFIRFDKASIPPAQEYLTVDFEDLILQWPTTVTERIERSFLHLARGQAELSAGRSISDPACLFVWDHSEAEYFLDAMKQRRWLDLIAKGTLRITPEGWDYFDQANKVADLRNPAFVAMWFGGEDHEADMTRLFNEALRPACNAGGWKANRSDTRPHNDQIMGRILQDIRLAPFVIADLTMNNSGVYYEAGFAHGLGKDVIYCCPKLQKNTHFDVSGIQQVRYSDAGELRSRLLDQILWTKGRGPHALL